MSTKQCLRRGRQVILLEIGFLEVLADATTGCTTNTIVPYRFGLIGAIEVCVKRGSTNRRHPGRGRGETHRWEGVRVAVYIRVACASIAR